MMIKVTLLLIALLSVMAQASKSNDPSICDLPKVVGPCRGAFPRFFFNKNSGECENFIYGGCSGNGNNFESKEECERQCKTNMQDTKLSTSTDEPQVVKKNEKP